ncbi:lipoprotein transmembrane [Croceicoccus estronivorus]|uniref:DUF4136 domain-containing protein n=1 Tax=Croceicoccus estronivorus TaxID=1172626 RepID=UPI00082EEF42|nr:DUF4136 domain-containing protein [Croceicoccus estronivorus]OCC25447.1 lipoprotein transmembrane [Croceicoccus estronivorus]
MENNWLKPGRLLKMGAAGLLLLAVAACAAPFKADVSRFQSQLPAPQGQTFAVVAEDPALAGGLEFAEYAHLVEGQMEKLGYQQAQPQDATMIVRFDYGVDNGRDRIRSSSMGRDPFYSPWYGYHPYWGYRPYYSRYGAWNYGWYDPWFDSGVESYTVYTSDIELRIDRAVDGERLFEGRAEAVSTSNRLQYLVPNLVEAMFTDFPGRSGETVRITIAPEKTTVKQVK